MSSTKTESRIDIYATPWDLSTFTGRVKYYFWITDPRLCFTDDKTLDKAKELRNLYRIGKEPAGTTVQQAMRAKQLYESAFHPDTGEKQNIFGRMSFQVPGGMAVTGAMLTFYRTNTAVIFWQWVNQSFNALVNYTNRNANSPLTNTQMGVAYVSATAAACVAAIGLKSYLSKLSGPLLQRYVPFAAVAAANCVNIPLMRQNEILSGVDVYDINGKKCGQSQVAAVKGISQVVLSRIVMCAPGMLLLPLVMEKLTIKSHWVRRNTWFHAPFQILGVGCCLIIMVPTACALFPQCSTIDTSIIERFEQENYHQLAQNGKGSVPPVVFYNKGL